MAERVEMGELDPDKTDEQHEREQEETDTNLDDDREREDDLLINDDGDDGDDGNDGDDTKPSNPFKHLNRKMGNLMRHDTVEIKDFLGKRLGLRIVKQDGTTSRDILNNVTFSHSENTGKIDGILFEGKKILYIQRGGIYDGKLRYYSYKNDNALKTKILKFKKLAKTAKEEHKNTARDGVEEIMEMKGLGAPTALVDDVLKNVKDTMGEKIQEKVDEVLNSENLTANERAEAEKLRRPIPKPRTRAKPEEPVDEGAGMSRDKGPRTQSKHWKDLANEETDDAKATAYETLGEVADLREDYELLEDNKKPESDEGSIILNEEINDNPHAKLERFKKWAKKNMAGLSAVAISVASILTTIITAAKAALKAGAKAVYGFGKALAAIAKTLGPVFSAVLGLIGTVLKMGAKGISFLAKNLWIVTIAVVFFVYDRYKGSKTKPSSATRESTRS